MAKGYCGPAETFEVGEHVGYSSALHPVNESGKVVIGKVKGAGEDKFKAKIKAKAKRGVK